MHTCTCMCMRHRRAEQVQGTGLKMTTTALSKMEASEAAQHTADIGERGTYGEFYYQMRCPQFE